MNTKDVATIAAAALGTAALTVTAFWAGPLDAGHDADAPKPMIAKARLVSRGIEFGLARAGDRTFKAGDQPEFELTALNTTNQAASTSVCVTMTASAIPSALSRTISMPSVLWRQEQVVSLGPNETKVLALCARTNLPANSVIAVSLQHLEQKAAFAPADVVALRFSTATNGASPFVAVAQ